MKLSSSLYRFVKRQNGAPMLEYAILLSLISGVAWMGVRYTGEQTRSLYNTINTSTTSTPVQATNPTSPSPPTTPSSLYMVGNITPMMATPYAYGKNSVYVFYVSTGSDPSVPLSLGNFSISGEGFGLEENTSAPCSGEALVPNDLCMVTVTFRPSRNGTHTGELTFTAAGEVQKFPLTGEASGLQSVLTWLPPGSVNVLGRTTSNNNASIAAPATNARTQAILYNQGNIPEDLTGRISIQSSQWRITSSTCNRVLEPEDNCTVDLTFTDANQENGDFTETLLISNGPSTVLNGYIRGWRLGWEFVWGSPTELYAAGSYTFEFRNGGNKPGSVQKLELLERTPEGPVDPRMISLQSSNCSNVIPAGATCQVVVSYQGAPAGGKAFWLKADNVSVGFYGH